MFCIQDWPDMHDRTTAKAGWVAERKYEIDSGAYFLSALHNYFATPGLANPAALLQVGTLSKATYKMNEWMCAWKRPPADVTRW